MASDGSASSAARSGPVVRVASDEGATVVWLAGEHDIATVPALGEELVAVTADDVVVDLGGATFIDASIVRVLRQASQRLGAVSARLVLRDPRPLARRVLTICGVAFEATPAAGGDRGRRVAPA